MEIISTIDPITYGVDAMRAIALQSTIPAQALDALTKQPVGLNVLVMLGLALLFIVPASWLFSKRD
jgi:ABC-type transport system involved in multi-copper enzyme maturation permease subunit